MAYDATIVDPRDRYGFPLRQCRRCGGEGRVWFSSLNGGRCFDCNGSGWTYPRGKVATIAAEFKLARSRWQRPSLQNVQSGDRITREWTDRVTADTQFHEVAGVVVHTDRPCGWTVAPAGERTATQWWVTVTYTDGTSEHTSNTMRRRAGVTAAVPVQPYLDRAGIRPRASKTPERTTA